MMKYKGYMGRVVFDDEAKLFHGEVIGLKDVITFQGTTVKELEKAFKDSIDDYIEWCKERGEEPQKTFSGNLRIRISPELHSILARDAFLRGQSLNSFIIEKLRKNFRE
jgi:predicted HicB family RNase H-like nuclease